MTAELTDVATDVLERVIVVGGAGFIGSHFVDHLLAADTTKAVLVYDNFSSGRDWHLEHHRRDPRLEVVRADIRDCETLAGSMRDHPTVIHLASNPDIARAMTEPSVDFDHGTLLTHQVLEAMRVAGARRILYASGSGVYGELGDVVADEDHGPLLPVSTYGASKLAGEALIASYCHMFDLTGVAFRFANVVGPRQTHGVGYDFVRRLLDDPTRLRILGDGTQSKSYVHVDDIVGAVLLAAQIAPRPFSVFNVATDERITVREIAEIACEIVGQDPRNTCFEYTGGDRGWKGDVPIVRLSSKRIRDLSWTNKFSVDEALRCSMQSMLVDAKAGRFG